MRLREIYDIPVNTIVFAEGAFGQTAGKTANGVVAHSTIFNVGAVVDSTEAGKDAGTILDSPCSTEIPIVASIDEAFQQIPDAEALVLGVAPVGGGLPDDWTTSIETAMRNGCDIISGLHEFFTEKPKWVNLADEVGVELHDIRKPPDSSTLRVADGRVDDADAEVVLTMGTDCAVGKRTTTFELWKDAQRSGLDAGWVATGQTGIMIGADAGVVIDRVPADFIAGVVEDLVLTVSEQYDLVFVEGQASLTHRAYSGVTLGILHGSSPDTVVLADDPERRTRDDFEQFQIAGVQREINAIESLAETNVVAISTWGDPADVEAEHGLPAGNVFHDGGADIILNSIQEAQ